MSRIYALGGVAPRIHPSAWIAPGACIIGDVEIGEDSSVWFGSIVRGDVDRIRIGRRTNIQDRSVLHVTKGKWPTILGDDVTVGHSVTLHGCRIVGRALIGMGAVLLDDVEIAEDAFVAAGALVTPGFRVPPRTLVAGVPAKVKRELEPAELERILESARSYAGYARRFREELREVPR